jgi:hypothetical protein
MEIALAPVMPPYIERLLDLAWGRGTESRQPLETGLLIYDHKIPVWFREGCRQTPAWKTVGTTGF